MLELKTINEQVLVARGSVVALGHEECDHLKKKLCHDRLDRIRICCHRTNDDFLHEMLMAFTKSTYIRPSLHTDKDESLLFLEGFGTILFFDEIGNVTDRVILGPLGSGRAFYCRVDANRYHCLIVESDQVLVKETASGPFRPEMTKFAPWAPDGSDQSAVDRYLETLRLARRHR